MENKSYTNIAFDLDAIEKRVNSITPGCWVYNSLYGIIESRDGEFRSQITKMGIPSADGIFIAYAPSDIRALINRIRELESK